MNFNLKIPALVVLAALVTVSITGCGVFKKIFGREGQEIEVLPQQLAEEGMEAMAEERYNLAAEKFQNLKDRYPYSRYAILAELKLADALFLRGRYIEAAEAYQEFERLHPKNEAVPYVIYQLGMCYFKQMPTYDRDQSNTVKSIQTFTRLRQTYPESKYAAMAAARLTEAQKNLAGHEFYVGRFYFNMGAYKAALGRFMGLIKNYPDAGYHNQAIEFIRLCREKLAEIKTAEAKEAEGEKPETDQDKTLESRKTKPRLTPPDIGIPPVER